MELYIHKPEVKTKGRRVGNRMIENPNLPKGYISYFKKCETKGIRFELTPELFYIYVKSDCEYCGKENSGGIDRVNSKLGYTTDNMVPCCNMCNMMKFNYKDKDFINHVAKIYKHNFTNAPDKNI